MYAAAAVAAGTQSGAYTVDRLLFFYQVYSRQCKVSYRFSGMGGGQDVGAFLTVPPPSRPCLMLILFPSRVMRRAFFFFVATGGIRTDLWPERLLPLLRGGGRDGVLVEYVGRRQSRGERSVQGERTHDMSRGEGKGGVGNLRSCPPPPRKLEIGSQELDECIIG